MPRKTTVSSATSMDKGRRQLSSRIVARMKERNTNAKSVSLKAGLGATAVTDILTGKNQMPSVMAVRSVADVLDCDVGYLVGQQDMVRAKIDHDPRPARHEVQLVGDVRAGAEIRVAPDQQYLGTVPAPYDYTDKTVAVRIRGDSLGQIFDGWLAFYDDVRRPVTTDLIGELCVVWLPDGRAMIKQIKSGRDGTYNLVSNVEDTIVGASVSAAAKVTDMRPR